MLDCHAVILHGASLYSSFHKRAKLRARSTVEKDRHNSKLIKTGCLQSSLGRPLVTKSSGTEDCKWLGQSWGCEDGKERAGLGSRCRVNRTPWLMGDSSSRSRARVSIEHEYTEHSYQDGISGKTISLVYKGVFFEGLVTYPWQTSNSESSELYLLCPGIFKPTASCQSFEFWDSSQE